MLRLKSNGFVLADSMVALTILSIGIAWYCVNERQLQSQIWHARQELVLARIAKEASDQFLIDHQKRQFSQKGYFVSIDAQSVKVKQNDKLMLTVAR